MKTFPEDTFELRSKFAERTITRHGKRNFQAKGTFSTTENSCGTRVYSNKENFLKRRCTQAVLEPFFWFRKDILVTRWPTGSSHSHRPPVGSGGSQAHVCPLGGFQVEGLGPVWSARSGGVCGDALLHLILLKHESESFGPHSTKNITMQRFQCYWIVRHWKHGKSCYFPPLCHITTANKLDYSWKTFLKIVLFSTQTKGSIFFLSLGLSLVFFFFCTFYSH